MSVDVERPGAGEPLTAAELEEFDRWAEARRFKPASRGMLWALRLRATLAQAEAERERLREAVGDWAAAFDEWSLVSSDDAERWDRYAKASGALRAALAEPAR